MPKTVLPAHQARSRESLKRLLKAAVEILNTDGLDRATIPRIAARAGLSPGAVYRRFADKDALLREVAVRILEDNYHGTRALMEREDWQAMSLAELSRHVIAISLKGHRTYHGLLRALFFFTHQHPQAAFVRKMEELEWKVFRDVSELLLLRRDEIHHPDPEAAVRFALLTVGVMATGVFVVPRDPNEFAHLVPNVEAEMERELPRMFLRFLGVSHEELGKSRKPGAKS
jgi:AcrR family transcriptional regulator